MFNKIKNISEDTWALREMAIRPIIYGTITFCVVYTLQGIVTDLVSD